MGCKTEKKEIGGVEYSVRQWPATESMLMKFKLIEVFGPVLALLASLDKNKENNTEISTVISSLFKANPADKVVTLIQECIVLNVACDGKKITLDKYEELFAGDNLLDAYKVLGFVIKVNYAGFFKGQQIDFLLTKMAGIMKKMENQALTNTDTPA